MRVSEVMVTNIVQIDMERLAISVRGKGDRERETPIVSDATNSQTSTSWPIHLHRFQLCGGRRP
jgi:site-specific recombinase XerC